VTPQSQAGSAFSELTSEQSDKSVGGFLRGMGKLVKGAASDLANSVRRPPLVERPQDAALTIGFEGPRQELAGIERWKLPMMPEFRTGPRMVQVHFVDGSWSRVQTTVEGAQRLTGSP
jgi:hypothetical protein